MAKKKRKQYRTIEVDLFGAKVQDTINSKVKGDVNERVASKVISSWTGQKFIRTPSSGGRRLENASNFCGDVVCENEDFNFLFTIETKHYADFATPILDGRTLHRRNKLLTFWKQAIADADRSKKLPMALARKNGMPEGTFYVVIDVVLFGCYLSYANILDIQHAIGLYEGRNYAVFHSDDLKAKFPYENFATYINNHYICRSN